MSGRYSLTQMMMAATNREVYFKVGMPFDVEDLGDEHVYQAAFFYQLGFVFM